MIMEDDDFYFTIEKPGTAEYRERGSTFIAYTFPLYDVAAFKLLLNEIKRIHPKATHHCFAYRIGEDGNQFRVSDDGEPSGTAGRPILGQIDSKQLVNILLIVVRYFGGTLLGVPGLIHAYKSSAALALQMTPLIKKVKEKILSVQFDYTQMNEVMIIIKQYQCRIISKDLQLFCSMKIAIPRHRLSEVTIKFGELRDVILQ
jgi:uncharacterized YigZ family protein